MSWWEALQSYELQDFLMFSPAVYFRMVESYVTFWWPLSALFLLGFAGAAYSWRQSGQDWPVWGLLALAWTVPVPLFFLARYGKIMSAAPAFATLFALQAALLLIARAQPAQRRVVVRPLCARIGGGLMVLACLLYPAVAIFAGRSPAAFEPVLLMPDPAVPLTLGWFLLCGERRVLLWLVPLAWAVLSALTLHTMGEADYWLLPALTGLALTVAFMPAQSAPKSN